MHTEQSSNKESFLSESAECKSINDVKRHHGKKVLVKGRYEVEPVPGSKRLQAVSIVLPDRTRLIRAYKPVKEEFGYINKQVMVIGMVLADDGESSHVQQVMAPHITNIESITLAPGEIPYQTIPEKIPDLPFIEKKEDLAKWENHWIHLYGRLKSVKKREDESNWANAQFWLPDGTRIIIEWVPFSRWKSFIGNSITITLRLNLEKEEKGICYLTGGRTALCEGKTCRCGMD